MMAGIAEEKVFLGLGGFEWDAWSDFSATLGIERCARSATLALSATDPRKQRLIRIAPSLPCTVAIGNDIGRDLVITGYIDDDTINPRNGTKYSLAVRSATEDIVDCTVEHPVCVWRGKKLEVIAAEVCAFYGITVYCDVDTGPAIPSFTCKRTEKVFAVLDRLSAERGLLWVDDAAGNLHISSVDPDGPIVRSIIRGRDYEELGRTRSAKDRFQTIRCLGQSATEIDASGLATDGWMRRKRVLTIAAEKAMGAVACKKRADWEMAVRAGKSVKYNVTLPGWRTDPTDPASRLHRPNTMYHLYDPIWEIDTPLLCGQVQFGRSVDDGTRTQLTLGSPYGYLTKPPKSKAGKRQMTDWFSGTDFSDSGAEGDGSDSGGDAE
jgi:prophage tail gpP-like protein